MAKVKVRGSAEDVEKASADQGDFVVAPKGLYVLTGVECNAGFSKDQKTGEEDRSRPRLEFIWKITGVGREDKEPAANYGQVWDYMAFSEQSGWSRARYGKALGLIEQDHEGDFEFDYETDDFPETRVLARLDVKKGRTKDDPQRNKIGNMWHIDLGDTLSEEAFGSDSGADIPDEDVFGGGEDDVFGGEDPEPEGVSAEAFQAELEAKDLKELGNIAKDDYELTPQDYVVKKGKNVDQAATKAKIIEAIVEAATGTDDDGSSEDPF